MRTPVRTLLLLDKVLLGPCPRHIRGVELFNLNLIRDLSAQDWDLTVAADASWHAVMREKAAGGRPLTLPAAPAGGLAPLGPLGWGWMLGRRRYDVLLLGNVANRLVPALVLLRWRRVAPHCVLIAHREPSRRTLWAQKRWPSTVIAVNRVIAGHFERLGFSRVTVHYGVTDAGRFYPPPVPRTDDDVRFCVAGRLDNPWKGADTAVAAFRLLPSDVRRRCRLYLASYVKRPDFGDDAILPCDWMPAEAMPDFFRRMDVMIVPSRDEEVMRETFSQVMVQGMLSGLPQLVNRLPILEEKLDCGGGLVFDTPQTLCDAMVRMANEPAERQRMGRQARETALARYVWDTRRFADRFLPAAVSPP